MSFQSTQCPLLDLPPELRLQIYDAILALPLVDCQVDIWRQSTQATPALDVNRLPIPWLNLVLVCKTIANELRYHVQTSGNATVTTYKLELDNLKIGQGFATTWRQIPCPPTRARMLLVELGFYWKTLLWGDGGPTWTLSALYQVLNRFIHNGPLLSRGSPLTQHIHLDALIVQIRVAGAPDGEEKRQRDKERVAQMKKRLCNALERYISRVVMRGVLFGAVDKIVCRSADDGTETKWEVCRKRIGDMTEWNVYGFHWGVTGSSSLDASGVLPEPEPSHSDASQP